MPEQHPELAWIVGILKRHEQVLEIAAERAIAEEVAVGQIDFIDDRSAQVRRNARQIELCPLPHPPPAILAVWIDQPFGKAPSGNAEIVRLDDYARIWVE